MTIPAHRLLFIPLFIILFGTLPCRAQDTTTADQPERTILAIGAHAGDVELTSGALLVKHSDMGDRVVILHLTLGEGGNPSMSTEAYAEQKRREADAAAAVIGAEVIYGPYADGEVPDDEEVRRYIARVIREVKPTHIITHWKHSIHKDHARTHAAATDAVLLAALPGVDLGVPAHRGVRGIYFAENWEDAEGFEPYLYFNVSEAESKWRLAVQQYEFVGGEISSFPYLKYYTALHALRGAEARTEHAIAFDIAEPGKRRILDAIP